jgi:tetratricopeptide (TPR) repeat protein
VVDSSLSPIIIKYEKLLEADPRSRVFAPLAEAYRKVGLLENAFNVLKKGLRYNPDYLLGYLTLAQCYMDKGEINLSYSTLRPLVSQNRDNIKLQKLFGESAILTGNKEEALDTFKYLLFLQPRDQESAQRVMELEKELEEEPIYNPLQDIEFNVEELKPSPELDKSLDDWVQVDLNQPDDESDPDEFVEAQEIGDWSTQDSDSFQVSQAKEDVDEGPIEEPVPVITHTLVDLYLKQGHKEKAIELLEKIREIQPDNAETLERIKALKAERAEESSADEDDEGRNNLMAAFDSTSLRVAEEASLEDQGTPKSDKVVEVLQDFAGMLRTHAEDRLNS